MNKVILYKYRDLKNRDRIKIIFLEQKVWFAQYSSFNDPFEFRYNFSFEATDEEKIDFITKVFLKHGKPVDAHSIVSDKQKLDAFEKHMEQQASPNEHELELGIFSLSKNKENILLWSHYTNGHTGICIEFKAMENNPDQREFLGRAANVTYPEFNIIMKKNLYKDRTDDIRHLFYKAKFWEYEEEYRIVVTDGSGHKNLPEGIISAVYLGCNISNDDRIFMLDLVNKYPTPINVYQAKMKKEYYELEFSKIN